MLQSLRTHIGQFSSAQEQWQPRAINVRAVEPAADLPSAQRGSLYILAEVNGSGGGHAALYRQILNAAQNGFYEMGENVDSALRQAVRNVHAVLRRANEALPEATWRAGISMVVRYGRQVIIAQAGPALILVSHARTIDQFPAEAGASGPALGGLERPEVQIYDVKVEAGSMLLIAQSDWLQHVTPEALAIAAAAADVNLASDYLGQLAGSAELSALLISFVADVPELREETPMPLAGARARIQPTAAAESQPVPSAPGPSPRGFGLFRRQREPAQEQVAAIQPAKPNAFGVETPEATDAAETMWEPEGWPPTAEAGESGDALEHGAPAAGGRRSAWPLLLALIVIPLIIVAVVGAMLLSRGRAAEAQMTQLLAGASNIIAQAEMMPDEAAAAQHLLSSAAYLEQARAVRSDDPRLLQAQARYESLLARLQRITPLYGIVPLWSFKETGRQLDRVVVSGDAVFVLDRGAYSIHRFTRSALGDSVTPVEAAALKQGDQVGNLAVGSLVDMAWAEAAGGSQRSKLLVLDAAGGLVGVDVTWGQERLNVGGREQWVSPELIAGYGGNLYIADVGADQIWRYRPADGGYADAEPYFQTGQAPDLVGLKAIVIDGNVWLLFADGRLLKYFAGEQRSFAWQGLPDPLSTPATVVVALEQDRVFVADTGNGRIIEVNKNGQFTRQFRAPEGDSLRALRSVYLDEAADMFYILTNDALFKADVPAPSTTP